LTAEGRKVKLVTLETGGREQMKRRAVVNTLIVLAIALGVVGIQKGLGAYLGRKQAQAAMQAGYGCTVDPNAKMYAGPNVASFGDANAPVQALWVLPNHALADESLRAIEEVKQWVSQHQNLVRLTIAVIHTPEAAPVMRAGKVDCAGFSIQGRTRFTVWDKKAGKFRFAILEKAPSPVSFLAAQVIDVLEQRLEDRGRLPRNRTLGRPDLAASEPL